MILADALSRIHAYINDKSENTEDLICAVNLIVSNLTVSDPMQADEMCSATEQDTTVMRLKNTIRSGWPEKRFQVHQDLV